MVPVGHEPSQLVELVNGQHVVVGGGIERHAEIFRIEEFLFIHVVACHEYVISSDAFLSLGGIVKRDTVGKHERIVLRIISVQLVQFMRSCPLASHKVAGKQSQVFVLIRLSEIYLIAQFGQIDRTTVFIRTVEKCAIRTEFPAFRTEFDMVQERILVYDQTVYDRYPFRSSHHGAQPGYFLQFSFFHVGRLPFAFQLLDVLIKEFFRLVKLVMIHIIFSRRGWYGLPVLLRLRRQGKQKGTKCRQYIFLHVQTDGYTLLIQR